MSILRKSRNTSNSRNQTSSQNAYFKDADELLNDQEVYLAFDAYKKAFQRLQRNCNDNYDKYREIFEKKCYWILEVAQKLSDAQKTDTAQQIAYQLYLLTNPRTSGEYPGLQFAILNRLSVIERQLGLFDSAIELLNLALQIGVRQTFQTGETLVNMSAVQLDAKEYHKAKYYVYEAIKELTSEMAYNPSKGTAKLLGIAYYNAGKCDEKLHDLQDAVDNYKAGIKILKNAHIDPDHHIYKNLSFAYIKVTKQFVNGSSVKSGSEGKGHHSRRGSFQIHSRQGHSVSKLTEKEGCSALHQRPSTGKYFLRRKDDLKTIEGSSNYRIRGKSSSAYKAHQTYDNRESQFIPRRKHPRGTGKSLLLKEESWDDEACPEICLDKPQKIQKWPLMQFERGQNLSSLKNSLKVAPQKAIQDGSYQRRPVKKRYLAKSRATQSDPPNNQDSIIESQTLQHDPSKRSEVPSDLSSKEPIIPPRTINFNPPQSASPKHISHSQISHSEPSPAQKSESAAKIQRALRLYLCSGSRRVKQLSLAQPAQRRPLRFLCWQFWPLSRDKPFKRLIIQNRPSNQGVRKLQAVRPQEQLFQTEPCKVGVYLCPQSYLLDIWMLREDKRDVCEVDKEVNILGGAHGQLRVGEEGLVYLMAPENPPSPSPPSKPSSKASLPEEEVEETEEIEEAEEGVDSLERMKEEILADILEDCEQGLETDKAPSVPDNETSKNLASSQHGLVKDLVVGELPPALPEGPQSPSLLTAQAEGQTPGERQTVEEPDVKVPSEQASNKTKSEIDFQEDALAIVASNEKVENPNPQQAIQQEEPEKPLPEPQGMPKDQATLLLVDYISYKYQPKNQRPTVLARKIQPVEPLTETKEGSASSNQTFLVETYQMDDKIYIQATGLIKKCVSNKLYLEDLEQGSSFDRDNFDSLLKDLRLDARDLVRVLPPKPIDGHNIAFFVHNSSKSRKSCNVEIVKLRTPEEGALFALNFRSTENTDRFLGSEYISAELFERLHISPDESDDTLRRQFTSRLARYFEWVSSKLYPSLNKAKQIEFTNIYDSPAAIF